MRNFGYSLNKSSVIDLEKADTNLAKEIAQEEPSFLYCIYCGTCTGTCTAGNFTDFNLRKIQLLVKRGQIEEIKNLLPNCMLCGKCQMACPKGVNTRHVLLILNRLVHARKI
ncbi:MAG: 4Fe-4S dicluster domain-containing protein [Bacteroidales bacterium]